MSVTDKPEEFKQGFLLFTLEHTDGTKGESGREQDHQSVACEPEILGDTCYTSRSKQKEYARVHRQFVNCKQTYMKI